jgi:hypothetical protein
LASKYPIEKQVRIRLDLHGLRFETARVGDAKFTPMQTVPENVVDLTIARFEIMLREKLRNA